MGHTNKYMGTIGDNKGKIITIRATITIVMGESLILYGPNR